MRGLLIVVLIAVVAFVFVTDPTYIIHEIARYTVWTEVRHILSGKGL